MMKNSFELATPTPSPIDPIPPSLSKSPKIEPMEPFGTKPSSSPSFIENLNDLPPPKQEPPQQEPPQDSPYLDSLFPSYEEIEASILVKFPNSHEEFNVQLNHLHAFKKMIDTHLNHIMDFQSTIYSSIVGNQNIHTHPHLLQ